MHILPEGHLRGGRRWLPGADRGEGAVQGLLRAGVPQEVRGHGGKGAGHRREGEGAVRRVSTGEIPTYQLRSNAILNTLKEGYSVWIPDGDTRGHFCHHHSGYMSEEGHFESSSSLDLTFPCHVHKLDSMPGG